MTAIRKFVVTPSLPPKLQPLLDIARNIWWTWNPEAINLLRRVAPELWDRYGHNPVAVLGSLSAERVNELTKDGAFLAHLERVRNSLERYLSLPTWFENEHAAEKDRTVAYFSLEFGLHECLPLYSGGLGILAGDHLKSATDLGVPLVGVGLAYQFGYFRQYLNHDGWQQEDYPVNDFYNMSLTRILDDDGVPLVVEVPFPGRTVAAHLWQVEVGRNPLYLLDTNLLRNAPADRELTSKLYSGDNELRIQQEVLLGIGGLRALSVLGIEPEVCHMNEGHAAFLALERIRTLMKKQDLSYEVAFELVRASSVFTTHTPVPAGNDMFPRELVEKYLRDMANGLGIGIDRLIALGRVDPANDLEPFCMTVLALRMSRFANGVSELHGSVSRDMWRKIWPGAPTEEIPITHITNGVHTQTWACSEISQLYDRYLGPRWHEDPTNHQVWDRVSHIPDAELWRSHSRMRERLVGFVRRRLRSQLKRRGANRSYIQEAKEVLDPDALTIGFARRFATYKRANLILRDVDRLARLLNDADRPVQLIFAGKAHPKDHPGKELIRQLIHLAKQDEFRHRIAFIEDYNIEVARYMVQGVDIWLNNPRRPLEASGTSGMKVPANGGINFSVLDGWWCEGFRGDNGWSIGAGEDYEDQAYQDEVESTAMYDMLEAAIVPLFYDRSKDGVPREWTRIMKNSMQSVNAAFNTHRMVEEYVQRFYAPCLHNARRLRRDEFSVARDLAEWRSFVEVHWPHVAVVGVEADSTEARPMGSLLPVTARVRLGSLTPEDVLVELYHGLLDTDNQITGGETATMLAGEEISEGIWSFSGDIPCRRSGQRGFTIRVVPRRADFLIDRFETGRITWWSAEDEKGAVHRSPQESPTHVG